MILDAFNFKRLTTRIWNFSTKYPTIMPHFEMWQISWELQVRDLLSRTGSKLSSCPDCLISLAIVASQPGYQKPEFVSDDRLEIIEGRHPMVEVVRSEPFIPNSISLGEVGTALNSNRMLLIFHTQGHPRSKIITGTSISPSLVKYRI